MDFPVMNLHIQNNIVSFLISFHFVNLFNYGWIFFNVDLPSVQKVELVDNTHFNPTWYSREDNPPKTRSIYTKVHVPFERY